MRLAQIMSSPVETVPLGASVASAREQMRRHRIHHVLVMDGEAIAGVVSSRDLAAAASDEAVAEHMSPIVVVAEARDTVRETANRLRGRGVGCLPVVEGGRLVGIVTISDLLGLLGNGVERAVRPRRRHALDSGRGR